MTARPYGGSFAPEMSERPQGVPRLVLQMKCASLVASLGCEGCHRVHEKADAMVGFGDS